MIYLYYYKLFENCFIKSLENSLNVGILFQEKFETSWRKLIQFIFKHYTDGMDFEKKEDIEFVEKYSL
jgi:hypothetical protein